MIRMNFILNVDKEFILFTIALFSLSWLPFLNAIEAQLLML